MKKEIAMVGPIPQPYVPLAIQQIEEQGWSVPHVMFAGMVQSPQNIVSIKTAQPQAFPAYNIVVSKEIVEGEKVEFPKLDFSPKGGPDHGKTAA